MIEYQIFETGFFYADGGAMFGPIPKRAWNRKYPSDADNCCRLSMRSLLLWNDDKVILFDTGVGSKDLKNLSYYRFHGLENIADQVKSFGFNPEDITDIVLSHLHFDHCGGCTYFDENGELKLVFPNARHWVSKKQWDNFLNPNLLEEYAYRSIDMSPVADAGLLNFIELETKLMDGLFFELYDGHTPGQIVSFFEGKEGLFVYPGDVIPMAAHISIEWISAYDICPLHSVDSKVKLLEKLKGKGASIVFYHDTITPVKQVR